MTDWVVREAQSPYKPKAPYAGRAHRISKDGNLMQPLTALEDCVFFIFIQSSTTLSLFWKCDLYNASK